MAIWEHNRWNRFMVSRGWMPAELEDAEKYYRCGNTRQQLYIGRLHPCIIPYEKLGHLEKKLADATGLRKNFRKSDFRSIQNTEKLLHFGWTRKE